MAPGAPRPNLIAIANAAIIITYTFQKEYLVMDYQRLIVGVV